MLVNLTPHDIVIRPANGEDVILAKTGVIARVTTTPGVALRTTPEGVEIWSAPTMGAPEGVPDPDGQSIFVVSAIVAAACKGRADIASPDTGPTAIRNEAGQIQAVRRLIMAPPA